MIFMCENRLNYNEGLNIKWKLGYSNAIVVSSLGRKWGLILMWNHDILFSLISYSPSHIDADMENIENFFPTWWLTNTIGEESQVSKKINYNGDSRFQTASSVLAQIAC